MRMWVCASSSSKFSFSGSPNHQSSVATPPAPYRSLQDPLDLESRKSLQTVSQGPGKLLQGAGGVANLASRCLPLAMDQYLESHKDLRCFVIFPRGPIGATRAATYRGHKGREPQKSLQRVFGWVCKRFPETSPNSLKIASLELFEYVCVCGEILGVVSGNFLHTPPQTISFEIIFVVVPCL